MANIKPFKALRPARELTSRVAALPYDVYNRAEAYVEAARDRHSFLNIDRPETQFSPDQDMYADEVYEKARDMLKEQTEQGIYAQDPDECYYLYELTMNGRSQTGLVACASIDDYLNGIIKKHENTRAEKEKDRIRHVDTCSAQTGPIFLAYRKNETVSSLVELVKRRETLFDFTSEDQIRHRGWMISNPEEIETLRKAFNKISEIYIADGHHRAASAVKVGQMRRQAAGQPDENAEYNYFLSILFPDDELMIMDYNRAVKDLNGMTEEEFLNRIREKFILQLMPGQAQSEKMNRQNNRHLTQKLKEERRASSLEARRPKEKGCISMFLGNQWYTIRIPSQLQNPDPVEGLDVSILQKELLGPILGIGDPREDKRIDFIGGIRGMEELERRVHSDCAVAFAMYPTSIGELFQVADAGMLMPPKSTWFEPKLRSGLFIHKI